ncbi:hypothetical protein CRUP_010822 [Coryphaenoides rupestris]|nr:hypothetical protein CRUP_010822 [Coryphaenoides rupestris]
MQHLRSSVEHQGASPAHSPQKKSSTPGSDSRRSPSFYRSSMLRGECGSGLYLPEGARLWAWILLWALVAPGACGQDWMCVFWFCWSVEGMYGEGRRLTDTGENLFVSTGTLDIREAMEQWFMENLQYNYHNNSCEGVMCGHYTQVKGHNPSHHRHREELHFLDEYGQPIAVHVEDRRGRGHRKRHTDYAVERQLNTLRAMGLVTRDDAHRDHYG